MYKDIYAEMQIQDAEERQRLGNISLWDKQRKQLHHMTPSILIEKNAHTRDNLHCFFTLKPY
jgi:hypothetical protein